jgi:dTDP-glucose 4,6-dehydratase
MGEDWIYWLDSSRISKELGWEQEIGLDEGLKEMVAWGRQYFEVLNKLPPEFVFHA